MDSIAEAIEALRRAEADALVVSVPVNGWAPREILSEIAAVRPSIPVILFDLHRSKNLLSTTGGTSVPKYFGQPGTSEELLDCVRAALASARSEEVAHLSHSEPWRKLLVGDSGVMREVVETIALVGNRRATVLITGETGTGKEMVARAIHMASKRGRLPMVAVNCAAIPENLVEAELFGHSKGAFTGAVNDRVGRFEQAHRGTIFLDEIGEIPLQIQPKLLRVLQEREFQRVGSSADHSDRCARDRGVERRSGSRRRRRNVFAKICCTG